MYHSRRIGRQTLLSRAFTQSSSLACADSFNHATVPYRYLICIHSNGTYNSYPSHHGCNPADTSNAPCHPRSLRPFSQRTTLTARARASMPHSTTRSPLSQDVSISVSSWGRIIDVRIEPVEVVPLLDVIYNPIRRDAFSYPTFPQDPLVVFVYSVGTEPGNDDEDSRLQGSMSFVQQKSMEALTAPWVVASEISSARCRSFNLRIITRRLQVDISTERDSDRKDLPRCISQEGEDRSDQPLTLHHGIPDRIQLVIAHFKDIGVSARPFGRSGPDSLFLR